MTTYNNKLEVFQANSKSIIVFVTNNDNEVFDLTDYAANLYGRKFPIRANSPIDISIGASSFDISTGSILFNLSTNDTNISAGDYLYEVIINDGYTEKHTVLQDRLTVLDSIIV